MLLAAAMILSMSTFVAGGWLLAERKGYKSGICNNCCKNA